ncbi:MAG: hypothetical protein NZ898_12075 [Myxococcota bacterium]|nr:hypothetical protein [Myxococcota bacterium]MDW8362116.1 hypothetical protein [Myxococcales bacterium]
MRATAGAVDAEGAVAKVVLSMFGRGEVGKRLYTMRATSPAAVAAMAMNAPRMRARGRDAGGSAPSAMGSGSLRDASWLGPDGASTSVPDRTEGWDVSSTSQDGR